MSLQDVLLEFHDSVALIKINRPSKGNAMTSHTYELFTQRLREAEASNALVVMVTGEGRFYSAGADVSHQYQPDQTDLNSRVSYVKRFASGSLDLVNCLAQYSKPLVAAVNGPAVGFSAGLLGHFDFIYAAEGAYLFTPFTSLGLTAEGGSSVTFIQRMGVAKAKEALYLGKRLSAQELKACGFVNEVMSKKDFVPTLVKQLNAQFGHLDSGAVLRMKKMLRDHNPDSTSQNMKEILGVIAAFESGVPQEKFKALAAKL